VKSQFEQSSNTGTMTAEDLGDVEFVPVKPITVEEARAALLEEIRFSSDPRNWRTYEVSPPGSLRATIPLRPRNS
jgi:hypothetical protein